MELCPTCGEEKKEKALICAYCKRPYNGVQSRIPKPPVQPPKEPEEKTGKKK